MVVLHLDGEEACVLTNMLEECLHDLHNEIVRTERSEYREMLKTRAALLKKILLQLEITAEAPRLA
jgi:hypothetical protein